MQYTVRSEKEIQEMNLLPKGEYDFEVVDAWEKQSAKGNDMIELRLKVYDKDGKSKLVTDYLLDSIPHKLRHAAYSCGAGENYENLQLSAEDFRGKSGAVKIGIQVDKEGKYPDKNVVLDYVVERKENGEYRVAADKPHDDSILF